MPLNRNDLLVLNDDDLLLQCRTDCFRATGPGGQHRNKTDSAIRLTVKDYPGISATAVEDRSQHRNRMNALKRLRREIAYKLRETEINETWTDEIKMNIDNPRYPFFIALVLDALFSQEFRLGDSARLIGLSTGQLNKALQRDKQLWDFINTERQKLGLKALRIK